MNETATGQNLPKDRVIRMFISSTFRDILAKVPQSDLS